MSFLDFLAESPESGITKLALGAGVFSAVSMIFDWNNATSFAFGVLYFALVFASVSVAKRLKEVEAKYAGLRDYVAKKGGDNDE